MGNVAASGGYYIAAGADQIYADPLSITGSIGVFASLPNIHGMTKKLGINEFSMKPVIPNDLLNMVQKYL